MTKISVIDCEMGNIGSVVNIIKHIGYEAEIVSTKEQILKAKKLIFPGVGHWSNGVEKLNKAGVRDAIIEAYTRGTPIMGICLGMQLLFEGSEEGAESGLGLIPANIQRFNIPDVCKDRFGRKLRVPHMGWNTTSACDSDASILEGLVGDDVRFYFVHSFHAVDVPREYQLLTSTYGYPFVCGVRNNNAYGFQFHPEKSHRFGMQLIKNFIEKV